MTSDPRPADSHRELPVDADVEDQAQRPLHLRRRYMYVVFLGGFLGTVGRYLVSLVIPRAAGLPWPTLAVNLVGAFVLGLLLERLAHAGPDRGWLRLARLHVGTGVIGGFTTYSALVTESVLLVEGGRPGAAVAYLLVTFVCGALLTVAGIRLGAARA